MMDYILQKLNIRVLVLTFLKAKFEKNIITSSYPLLNTVVLYIYILNQCNANKFEESSIFLNFIFRFKILIFVCNTGS